MILEAQRPLLTFFVAGLASGLLNAGFAANYLEVLSGGAALPFTVAIATATIVERSFRRAGTSPGRIVLTMLLILLAYPAAVLGTVIAITSVQLVEPLPTEYPPRTVPLGTAVSVTIGAIFGATVIEAALRVAVGRWDRRVWMLFIGAGAVAGIAAIVVANSVGLDLNRQMLVWILFPVGCAAVATIFGYGLHGRHPHARSWS